MNIAESNSVSANRKQKGQKDSDAQKLDNDGVIQGKSDPFSPFSPMHIFAKEMNEEMKIGSSSCKPFAFSVK